MKKTLPVLILLYAPLAAVAEPYGDYQLRRLLAPTANERLAEARGKIYIYDGLTSRQIDRALNRHFERLDSMMFVRTVQVNADGSEQVADDGCE